jgi:hypothetical protein
MNQDHTDIFKDLSTEEKALLEKIETKLSSVLHDAKTHKFDHWDKMSDNPDFSSKHPEVLHPKTLTVGPYEITVTIKAEVSEVDSKGYLSDNIEVLEKFYHIPVKAKEDYQQYMNKFFEIFHDSLEKTCQNFNTKNDG